MVRCLTTKRLLVGLCFRVTGPRVRGPNVVSDSVEGEEENEGNGEGAEEDCGCGVVGVPAIDNR